MKIKYIAIAALSSALLLSAAVHAATITNTAGGQVTITGAIAGGVTVPNITFNPSGSIIMDGTTSATAFLLSAYNTQVLQKNSGKQFAMASDSNKIWWRDISGASAAVGDYTSGGTAVTDLGTTWHSL